jgi:hypothetical protein
LPYHILSSHYYIGVLYLAGTWPEYELKMSFEFAIANNNHYTIFCFPFVSG